MKKFMGAALLAGALGLAVVATTPLMAEQAREMARVAIHVDENDPARMTMALNNAANIHSYYADKGEEVAIRIVTYGPGLHMLRADTSPVADRIAVMALEDPNLTFAACGNTHSAMSRKAGGDVALIDEAEIVPSGAIELITLQQEGWSYLRP